MYKNESIRKIRIIAKFMPPQHAKEKIAIYILPKKNVLKLGQLIEYKMCDIFLEKSRTECGRKSISKPFFCKNKIEHISEPVVESIIQSAFMLWPS